MNALIVCVSYWEELSLTLPYNAHHFKSVTVLTTPDDYLRLSKSDFKVLGRLPNVTITVSNLWQSGGAMFNKWAVVENALRYVVDTSGWVCVMDSDIFIPKSAGRCFKSFRPGNLYTPFRRMKPEVEGPPSEDEWDTYPRHRNQNEWAGYMHVFHGSDPMLAKRPWYDTGWKHAGGGDTLFQRRWGAANKIRPPFDVLHIGTPALNWCGRTVEGHNALLDIWRRRRAEREVCDAVGAHPDERIKS